MKNKSTKRIITETKDQISPYDFETSLGNLHARIGQLMLEHGHTATLDWNPDFHYPYDQSPSPRFNIIVRREETEKEYETRISYENAIKEASEARDRAEFERLKKQYGE